MTEVQRRYAVALSETGEDFWIEFYWAPDADHAELQAADAHPEGKVVAVREVQSDGFYLAMVEGYEEPMPLRGPFPTYDEAMAAHRQAALDEWPEEELADVRRTTDEQFYLDDDAVRIARRP